VVQALTLRFHEVTKRFGAATILEGLTVKIPLSGVTFIVGASGSGKSVLCRLAVGLLKPDHGQVHLLGERVDTMAERALSRLRKRAPYLVQGPALLDWLDLRANVVLADPSSRLDGRAEAAMARLGVLEFASRKPPEVGPALRKRTAIARALVLQPTVLLLDEPTTGLDREAADAVNQALVVVKAEGVACLVVSHDHAALKRLADQVVEVRDRRIAYCGPAAHFKD
jgi:phospholipid/cholesterol/gamma-HCH transport system ATP-binding protein